MKLALAEIRVLYSGHMKITAKDFFLYLTAAVTLYVSAGSLISLLFAIINHLVADPSLDRYAYYGSSYSGGIQFAIASLIIIFPIYLLVSWILRKDIVAAPARADFWIRKWFIGLTLFVAGALVAGDLVALVFAFLGGELTTRFVLKVIVIAVVALAVFGYYLYDLKRTARGDMHVRTSLIGIMVIVMLVVLGAGFGVLGSPSEQRALRMDSERLSGLQSIQWEVINYWQTKSELPVTLSDLENDLGYFVMPTDPVTDEMYEYRALGDQSFELCADFETDSSERPYAATPRFYYEENDKWEHGIGTTCFERTIDPDRYPPFVEAKI